MDWATKIIAVGVVCTTLIQLLSLRQIRIVHRVINSRLDNWLAIEREQGKTAGREEERAESKEKPKP